MGLPLHPHLTQGTHCHEAVYISRPVTPTRSIASSRNWLMPRKWDAHSWGTPQQPGAQHQLASTQSHPWLSTGRARWQRIHQAQHAPQIVNSARLVVWCVEGHSKILSRNLRILKFPFAFLIKNGRERERIKRKKRRKGGERKRGYKGERRRRRRRGEDSWALPTKPSLSSKSSFNHHSPPKWHSGRSMMK